MAEFDLKKVPTWGWVVAGLGGVYLFYKQTTAANSAATSDTGTAATNEAGNGSFTEYVPVDQTSSTEPTYQTNEQWATAAINWLIAQGYDPGLANSAITKGINGGTDIDGNKMSVSEYSLWTLALQHLGSPPEPVSVSPPTSTPPPSGGGSGTPPPVKNPPPSTKPKIRYFTVTPWPSQGSTLYGIAKKYYHNGNEWPRIYNANKYGHKRADGSPGVIRNANLIYPGEKLIIP